MRSTNLKGLLWFLIVSTSFTAFGQPSTTPIQQQNNLKAQPLPPGTYRDLKPTQPLVLDTGSYTFIGLYFSPLLRRGAGGEALDARKARSLTLINCTFEGNGKGTGVLSSGDLIVNHSSFTNMVNGIVQESPAGSHRKVTLTSNRFTDNTTAISLNRSGSSGTATVDFTLKCNTFENTPQTGTNPITRKGLVIGEGVQLRAPNDGAFISDQIGGANAFDINNPNIAYPNANVWPTTTDRDVIPTGGIQNLNTPDGWGLSPNWVSIENHFNNGELIYHHFVNEFVGYGASLEGPVAFPDLGSNQWIVTGNQAADPTHVKACVNFDDPVILFPVLRIAVVDSLAFTSIGKMVTDSPYLMDAIPNPALKETRIGIYLPAKTEQAVLQILELATGKVLQTIPLQARGKLETLLDVSKAPSGLYGYRLVSDGKPEAVKKLIVMH